MGSGLIFKPLDMISMQIATHHMAAEEGRAGCCHMAPTILQSSDWQTTEAAAPRTRAAYVTAFISPAPLMIIVHFTSLAPP